MRWCKQHDAGNATADKDRVLHCEFWYAMGRLGFFPHQREPCHWVLR